MLEVKWGDPQIARDGIYAGEFYIHPRGEEVIYIDCPLCSDDGCTYAGNRWYTQACCYFDIHEKDVSLEVERWVAGQLTDGKSIGEVHAELTSLRRLDHPPYAFLCGAYQFNSQRSPHR
jgi:hypothetical protein